MLPISSPRAKIRCRTASKNPFPLKKIGGFVPISIGGKRGAKLRRRKVQQEMPIEPFPHQNLRNGQLSGKPMGLLRIIMHFFFYPQFSLSMRLIFFFFPYQCKTEKYVSLKFSDRISFGEIKYKKITSCCRRKWFRSCATSSPLRESI